jgi:hypothetical protein
MPPPVALAARPAPLTELGSQPVTLDLPLGPEPRRQIEQTLTAAPQAAPGAEPPATEGPALRLAIEDIRFDASPGRFYEVYLNLPDPKEATGPDSPYFAGTLSFFGLHGPHDPAHAMATTRGKTQLIDVTEAVRRLQTDGKLQGEQLKVTLIERRMRGGRPRAAAAPPPGVAAPAPPPAPRVTIGAIRLLRVGR